jgi:hypothetical protein
MMLMIQTPVPTPPVIVQTPMPPIGVDPNFLVSQIIPLIGMIGGMVAFVLVARWLFHSPIGEAIAEGIRLRRRRRYGLEADGGAEEPRVAALEEQVRMLSTQVAELGERLDFTERMLATQRDRRIGAGS